MGQARRRAHQGRPQDRRVPLSASSAARRTSSSRSARAPTSARTPTRARMGNYVPGIAVMNGPYFVETLEEVAKLRKAPTVIKWQEELAEQVRPQGGVVQLGAGLSPLLHQQGDQDAGRPEGPAHPHAAGADLAGIDPRAGRGAGRHGVRRDVSGPAAAGDRRRRAGLQQHPRRALLRGAEVRQRDQAHHAGQLRGGQRQVVRRPAEGLPGGADRGVRQGRRGDLEERSSGSRPRSSSSSRAAA